MVTGSKCRRRSTLVENSVESPDTLSRDRSLTKQSSSVFNQLPRSRLERVFGRRSALFSGGEGDQMLEERRKTTAALWLPIVVLTTALGIFASSCSRGRAATATPVPERSEEHTSELQSRPHLVCRLLLEK